MNTVRMLTRNKKIFLKTQSEITNSITEIKNTVEGMNSRLSDIEEHISDLENRVMETTQSEKQKEKQILKNENSL